MASHDTPHKPRPMPLPAWQRCGWVVGLSLLLVVLLISSASAQLSVAEPTDHSLIDRHLTADALDDALPHCQHGHGALARHHAMLRDERQELDPSVPTAGLTPHATPPTVPARIGTPHGLAAPPRCPVYLLTQRLRP